jgi:hypothetical protein
MQLLTIDSKKAKKLFWSVTLGVFGVVAATTTQDDPMLIAGAVLLFIVGFAPLYLWLMGSHHGLPLWPSFSAYAGSLSALPVLQKSEALNPFSSEIVLQALMTTAAFFLIGTLVWASLTAQDPRPPRSVLMLKSDTAIRSLMWCIVAGLLFTLNSFAGWVSFPGNTMQVVRGITGGLSFLGIFAMAYFHGVGMLRRNQIATYLTLVVLLIGLSLTSIMLANAIPYLAVGLMGYTFGKGRPPWGALAAGFIVMALLHPGKYAMREVYYVESPEKAAALNLWTLPAFYTEWMTHGVEAVSGTEGTFTGRLKTQDESRSTVFARAGNLHMLATVQQKSPREVPFLNGLTYEPIPFMLVPRFLMPDKSISHAGNIMLSVNYGLVDAEGSRNVSIGWSLVAEAYANFGYFGVFALSVFLASLYSIVTRLSAGVPITSFRFVSGLVVLAGITNENTLGVFITMQFQGVVGVALASVFLMSRRPNPFFDPSEGDSQSGPRRLIPSRPGDGVPAPSLLSSLVEGPEMLPATTGPRDVGTGGTVRTLPIRTPKRIARWMPRRVRAAVVAQYAAEEEPGGTETPKDGSERPRQVAVPYQNYRRYRG